MDGGKFKRKLFEINARKKTERIGRQVLGGRLWSTRTFQQESKEWELVRSGVVKLSRLLEEDQ